MGADSQGGLVWGITRDLFPGLRKVEPTLVHLDYSPGNVLWAEGRISAIVDWEEAAYGDPGIEVAYCRMQMYLKGTGSVAAEFMDAYEKEASQRVSNLGFGSWPRLRDPCSALRAGSTGRQQRSDSANSSPAL